MRARSREPPDGGVEVAEGHTNGPADLSRRSATHEGGRRDRRPIGPCECCCRKEPVEDRKRSSFPACEAGCSTPWSPEHAAYGGSRDDPSHKPASSVDAVRVPHGRRESAGDGVRAQQERSVEVAKPHRRGRWRGTWLLSKFREQRGVFVARGITVSMTDSGCAWEEPEPLAHKLPISATTFALPATLRSLCDSGGGGRRHGDGASREAASTGSALLHRGRRTSPTTEGLARVLPCRASPGAT